MSVDERVALRSDSDDRAAAGGRAASGKPEGVLVIAWQDPETRLISPVGLLEYGAEVGGHRFRYLRRAADLERFQPFLSFPVLSDTYTSDSLFPIFSQRIMSPRRSDFTQFLGQLNLDRDSSPWEQLARSEGRRTGDTVQVFPVPSVGPDGFSVCRFLVHGIRHVTGGELPSLAARDVLALRDSPDNPVNPAAVMVHDESGRPLGYVPDLLLEHLAVLRRTGPVSLVVEHVNGAEAPVHLRLLVRLDGTAPPGYRPMTGPGWSTYSDGDG